MDITITTYDNSNGKLPCVESSKTDLAYAQKQAAALESAAEAARSVGRVWMDDDGCMHWTLPSSTTE